MLLFFSSMTRFISRLVTRFDSHVTLNISHVQQEQQNFFHKLQITDIQ